MAPRVDDALQLSSSEKSGMNNVVVQGYIVVPESDLTAVENELPVHIDLTRKEDGCLVFEVTQDDKDNNKFYIYEEFASDVAFASHQQRVRDSKWGSIAKNVERFYKISGLDD